MTTHLKDSHGLLHLKISSDVVKDVCTKYSIPQKLPTNIVGPIPVIKGLAVIKDGLLCPECKSIATTDKSINKHWTANHGDLKKPASFETVYAQRLSKMPKCKRYFQVIIEEDGDATVPNMDLSGLRKKCDRLFEDYRISQFDDRMVSPWLATTRWHEHVSQYEWQHLRDLVKLPDAGDGDLVYLKDAVERIMGRAMKLLPETPLLALQKIVSPDPVKR